jgi:hypothetical protein
MSENGAAVAPCSRIAGAAAAVKEINQRFANVKRKDLICFRDFESGKKAAKCRELNRTDIYDLRS